MQLEQELRIKALQTTIELYMTPHSVVTDDTAIDGFIEIAEKIYQFYIGFESLKDE